MQNQPISATQNQRKTITWPTNFNNKLGCRAMVHIDSAPAQGIPESWLDWTVIEIRTADNSHVPTTWKLWAIRRFALAELIDLETMSSHGMPAIEFYGYWKENHPGAGPATPMAVYYYCRQDQ